MIQKTFGLSHQQIMWEENWINLVMKMKDMPYYKYASNKKNKSDDNAKEGSIDILESKFSKYIKK